MAATGEAPPRSPLENVLNFVPHGHEKALKLAFYNAAATVFVLFAVAATAAVYFVLQPFFRPLIWAVLFGSVLHPFKHSLSLIAEHWMSGLRDTGSPLVLGVVVLPVGVIEFLAQSVGSVIQRYFKSMTVVTIALLTAYSICQCRPESLLKIASCVKYTFAYYTHDIFGYFSTLWVWSLVVAFLLIVTFHWTPKSSRFLCCASMPVWIALLLHLASILGSYRAPVFFCIVALMIVGFIMEVSDIRNQQHTIYGDAVEAPSAMQTAWSALTQSQPVTMTRDTAAEAVRRESVEVIETLVPHSQPHTSRPLPSQGSIPSTRVPLPRQHSTNLFSPYSTNGVSSNAYIYSLMWACTVIQLWRNVWLWPLLAIPVAYILIQRLGSRCGLWTFLLEQIRNVMRYLAGVVEERKDALFPAPVRGLIKLTLRGDKKIMSLLEQSIDTFASIGAILLVIIFALVATFFLAIQIHAESMHLVRVTSNLVNSTILNNPDFQQLLPDGIAGMLDDMMANAYEYGREWTVKMVKSMIDEDDEEKTAQIETQVLELWDKVSVAWTESSSQHASNSITQGAGGVMEKLVEELKDPSGLFNISHLIDFVKENMSTFLTVVNASWTVLKGNISLALGALTGSLSLLLGGGTAVLNFLVSFIVFITALFYLLSASGEQYKPLTLFNKLTPAGSGSRFGQAVEASIGGVFAASFKMSFFYGLWTWLTHTLFKVNVVYIPAALAATLGAIPFLGTYWAALPAVLELWLVQGHGLWAIAMFVCQLLPMSCVDTTIYSEIKGGGHPYLTGLAVAGGIFCLGAEGAIMGPLLLCCLFVAMNMYTNMMQDSPVNDPLRRLGSKQYITKRTVSIL